MAKLACICGIKNDWSTPDLPPDIQQKYKLPSCVNKSVNNSYTNYLKNEKENGKKYKGLSNYLSTLGT